MKFTQMAHALAFVAVLALPAAASGQDADIEAVDDANAVEVVLDDFHRAASEADGEAYFGLFAAEGVFLGTDATERWTVDEFRAYAKPHFDRGRGWT